MNSANSVVRLSSFPMDLNPTKGEEVETRTKVWEGLFALFLLRRLHQRILQNGKYSKQH